MCVSHFSAILFMLVESPVLLVFNPLYLIRLIKLQLYFVCDGMLS